MRSSRRTRTSPPAACGGVQEFRPGGQPRPCVVMCPHPLYVRWFGRRERYTDRRRRDGLSFGRPDGSLPRFVSRAGAVLLPVSRETTISTAAEAAICRREGSGQNGARKQFHVKRTGCRRCRTHEDCSDLAGCSRGSSEADWTCDVGARRGTSPEDARADLDIPDRWRCPGACCLASADVVRRSAGDVDVAQRSPALPDVRFATVPRPDRAVFCPPPAEGKTAARG